MQLSQHSNEPLQYQDSYGVIDCLKCPAGNVKGRRRCEQAVETALYPSQPYEIALDLNELEKVLFAHVNWKGSVPEFSPKQEKLHGCYSASAGLCYHD